MAAFFGGVIGSILYSESEEWEEKDGRREKRLGRELRAEDHFRVN
jgi:hypothetical protein